MRDVAYVIKNFRLQFRPQRQRRPSDSASMHAYVFTPKAYARSGQWVQSSHPNRGVVLFLQCCIIVQWVPHQNVHCSGNFGTHWTVLRRLRMTSHVAITGAFLRINPHYRLLLLVSAGLISVPTPRLSVHLMWNLQ